MGTVAELSIEINARSTNVDAILARVDARLQSTNTGAQRTATTFGGTLSSGMQRSASSALSLQSAQARLEAQQGNLAGAAQRLQNALAQVSTTSVQTINAQRQLLAVQTQLATGTSALGGHFQSLQGSLGAVGGAIGGLPGQLLSVSTGIGAITAAIGIGVGVVKSFGDAFKFKANLDATTNSIRLQLNGVRDSNTVFAEGQAFAAQYGLTQQELTDSIQSSIGVMRASNATTTDLLTTLSRLQVLAPEKPISEAARALRELQSGDTTSIKELFNIAAADANRMKAEIQGGADAVAVLSGFLDKTGIGMDTLAARTEGAKGKMIELAQAQEQLQLAQAQFAQGPGLAILQGQIAVTSGATRLLSGDFAAMGQSLANATVQFGASSAGANAYFQALTSGQGIVAAQAAGNAAAAQATQLLTQAQTDGGGGAFQWAGAELAAADAALQAAAAASQDTLEQNRLAAAHQLGAGAADAAAGALRTAASALADDITKKQESEAMTQRLSAAQTTLASLGPAVAGGLQSAASAAAFLASRYGFAYTEALKLVSAQAALAGASAKVPMAGITEDRLSRDTTADRAKVKSDQALESNRKLLASINAINKAQNAPPKGGGGGGGGGGAAAPKASDQQKLNNALLSSQQQYDQKSEAAEQAHVQKIITINKDFAEKMKTAQASLAQSQLDGRAGFYNALGSIEDQGLRAALAAEYEAAFTEADAIAREKGADVGQKFLEAKQAAIQAQGQRASDIAAATKDGDKDKAAYLAGVDKLYREAEARRLEAIKNGSGSIAAERDAAIAQESESYTAAQEKIGTSADQAAARKIDAAARAGQAIDAEGAKVDLLTAKYDGLGAAGARAGVTPAATATGSAPPVPAPPTDTPAVSAKDSAIAAAIESLRSGLSAIENATKSAGDKVSSAVKSIPRSVT